MVPAILLAEAGLVWSGLLEPGEAVLVVAGLEASLLLAGTGEVVLVSNDPNEFPTTRRLAKS